VKIPIIYSTDTKCCCENREVGKKLEFFSSALQLNVNPILSREAGIAKHYTSTSKATECMCKLVCRITVKSLSPAPLAAALGI